MATTQCPEPNRTKLLLCSCQHEYQDEMYGKKVRVHNWADFAHNKSGGWRCTVCGVVR